MPFPLFKMHSLLIKLIEILYAQCLKHKLISGMNTHTRLVLLSICLSGLVALRSFFSTFRIFATKLTDYTDSGFYDPSELHRRAENAFDFPSSKSFTLLYTHCLADAREIVYNGH